MNRRIILFFLTVVLATGCELKVDSVSVTPDRLSLYVGDHYQLRATVKPDKASQNVTWKSNHPEIVTVSENGLLTAVCKGDCEILVCADGQTASCKVVVTDKTEPDSIYMVNINDSIILFTKDSVCFKMIKVEGGTFTMGSVEEQGNEVNYDEKPAHEVTLSTYFISETVVTEALWEVVMNKRRQSTRDAQCPAYERNWFVCQDFISSLNRLSGQNFRMPTEAEWEYAARGGKKSKGYKYAGSNTASEVAWTVGNCNDKWYPINVAQKKANELGLYDMSGNVWEWCSDYYASYSTEEQINPTGPVKGRERVIRGGSFRYSALYCRVACRSCADPWLKHYFGLRLVLQNVKKQ